MYNILLYRNISRIFYLIYLLADQVIENRKKKVEVWTIY